MYPIIGHKYKGRYRVEAPLGRGGMAEVYKVWDEQRSVHLALKLLREDLAQDPVFLRRFQREASSLAKLQHPNIVRFYGLEKDDLQVLLLMDFIEGTTLRELIVRAGNGGLPIARIQEILRDICAALNYAHNQGLLHCDIKAGNILLDKTGKAYLSDFGIARMSDAATATLVGAGTPAYMAPELVKGLEPTPQTDIYALGVVLYEMLTGGERPFTGEGATVTGTTGEKVRWEQVNLPPTPPSRYNPNVPPELEAVVLRCLEKDLSKRFATPLALLEAIQNPSKEKQPAATQPLREASWNAELPVHTPQANPTREDLPRGYKPPPKRDEPSRNPLSEDNKDQAQKGSMNIWLSIGAFALFIGFLIINANHQSTLRLQASQTERSYETRITQTAVANAAQTAIAVPTLTAAARLTARPTVTAVYPDNITSQTSQVLSEIAHLEEKAELVMLSSDRRNFNLIVDQSDDYMECEWIYGNFHKNFILETSFTTPKIVNNGWDFEIFFRDSGGNNQYRLTIYPNQWELFNFLKNGDQVDIIDSNESELIKPAANVTNKIKLVTYYDDGYLFINDTFVSRLDLSARWSGDDIYLCTGAAGTSGDIIRVISVRLWELPS